MKDMDKIRHLIEHWAEHNREHAKNYLHWAEKAEASGWKDVADLLRRIAGETEKVEELFTQAKEAIDAS